MNKEELIKEVNAIPHFVLRDVAVKQDIINQDGEGVVLTETIKWVEDGNNQAVTECNKLMPLAYVSKDYKLVQMSEMFIPMLEKIGECEGDVEYCNGFAIMDIFPFKDEFKIEKEKIGIVAYNSVNKTSALNIRFCVEHNNKKLTIPSSVASFRKVHMGHIGEMTQDYIEVITKIKESWNTIMDKFTKHNIDEESLEEISKNFKIDDNAMKHMKKKILEGRKYNLWDFCMGVFEYLSNRQYKSEVHRRKRLDKFVQNIFDYDLVMRI